MSNIVNKNSGIISGIVITEPQMFSCHGRMFYEFYLKIKRKSEVEDVVLVNVPVNVVEQDFCSGAFITLKGQIRSYNKQVDDKRKLVVFFYATELSIDLTQTYFNEILLQGYIGTQPKIRKTPLGRTICDVILAVNRPLKSDYIPCIFWGNQAEEICNCELGSKVFILGRLQSRKYNKEIDGKDVELIAYEISVNQIVDEEA